MKTIKLGTVWTATAKVWVIDMKNGRRKVLATCMDTPKELAETIAGLRKKGHKSLWSTGEASDRQYHG